MLYDIKYKSGGNEMKRKKSFVALLLSVMMLFAAGCNEKVEKEADQSEGSSVQEMTAGEYEISVNGYQEGMKVKVSLDENRIKGIEIMEHNETQGVSDAALETMPSRIVDEQSLSVDTVAGATMTSTGILEAVRKAIEEAGGKTSDFEKEEAEQGKDNDEIQVIGSTDTPEVWDETYDVVVVGGGFAGLAAAHTASTNGANTLLIDKMPVLGGNSQINGGVWASYTSSVADDLYKKLNLEPDSAEKHIEDTIAGGDFLGNRELVENFVYGSPVFLNLMLENGLKVRESITRPGGHYGYRTYTTENGVGSDIVAVQKKILEETDTTVMLETKMTKIYRDQTGEGTVVGIEVQTVDGMKNIQAKKGVILTTGGFSGDVDMRSKHVPALTEDIPTTNHVGATGEGITMAQQIGANTMHMSYIQLYPFADPNNGRIDATAVIPFSGPSAGIVYVDADGKRYVNEGERRDVCSRAAQNSGGFPTFSIFGTELVENAGFVTEEQLNKGIEAGRIFKAESLEELANMLNSETFAGQKINMDGAVLKDTIDRHNGFVESGLDPDFGKVIDKGIMNPISEGPYYAIPQWPSVHHTMGGLMITSKTEVQDIFGNVIPGLFAAGEVAGGIHGTNRLGSNAIPDAGVHGMIAGQYAATKTLPEFVPER